MQVEYLIQKIVAKNIRFRSMLGFKQIR